MGFVLHPLCGVELCSVGDFSCYCVYCDFERDIRVFNAVRSGVESIVYFLSTLRASWHVAINIDKVFLLHIWYIFEVYWLVE